MNLMSSRAEELYRRGTELAQQYWNRWPCYWGPSPWESPPPRLGPAGEDIKLEDARVRAAAEDARRDDLDIIIEWHEPSKS